MTPKKITRRGLLSAAGVTAADLLAGTVLPAAASAQQTASSQTAPASPSPLPPLDASPENLVANLVRSGAVPGAVLLIVQAGQVTAPRAWGNAALRPQARPVHPDTLFDLASLTKVVATTPAVARLTEQGKIDLDAPVVSYLSAWKDAPPMRQVATVRHLLTHTAGLPAGGAYSGRTVTLAQITGEIARSRQIAAPGEKFLYSDFSAITLQAIVEAVSGKKLDVYCREEFYGPLGMTDTGFRPRDRGQAFADRCAATTAGDDTPDSRGLVHDPTARALGGVSGNAGLFSTARDLARYARLWLEQGTVDGRRYLLPDTVRRFTAPQTLTGGARALGWDRDSDYTVRGLLPVGSFGHTGFTGTSIWMDPASDTTVILLTNSVHNTPVRAGVVPTRRRVSTAVYLQTQSLSGNPKRGELPPPGNVRTGLDTLVATNWERVRGRKLGIVCNHTAVNRRGVHIVDLATSANVTIAALFGPEHSIRGDVDASASDSKDAKSGLPVYSLYNLGLPPGQRYRPTPEQLSGVETLVFDIQDIGARFYTYIATLGYCLESCARLNIPIVVLDRPNPIGGRYCDGPLLDASRTGAFTHYHTLPVAHGMTVGELARLYNEERGIGAQLDIVPVLGWHRGLRHDETGLPWINPSPNIRNVRQALLYPGIGMLEVLPLSVGRGTDTPLSVGRGTDTPFEIVGAPFLDNLALADEMNHRALPGVRFTPTRFTPASSVHKGVECAGIQIHLWDRETCRPVAVGIHLADALARLHPDLFGASVLAAMANMVGNDRDPARIALRQSPESIIQGWHGDLQAWQTRRARFLRYA